MLPLVFHHTQSIGLQLVAMQQQSPGEVTNYLATTAEELLPLEYRSSPEEEWTEVPVITVSINAGERGTWDFHTTEFGSGWDFRPDLD